MTQHCRNGEQPQIPTPRAPEELEEKPGAGGSVPPASPSITSLFAGEQMSVLAKKRSDRGRRSAFHMTCPGTEDVFVNPASCQFSLFTKGINHLLLLSPLTPDPPARPALCRLEEAGKQFSAPAPPRPRRRLHMGAATCPASVGSRCGGPPYTHTELHSHTLTAPPPAASARPSPRLAAAARGWGAATKGVNLPSLPSFQPCIPPGAAGAAGWSTQVSERGCWVLRPVASWSKPFNERGQKLLRVPGWDGLGRRLW